MTTDLAKKPVLKLVSNIIYLSLFLLLSPQSQSHELHECHSLLKVVSDPPQKQVQFPTRRFEKSDYKPQKVIDQFLNDHPHLGVLAKDSSLLGVEEIPIAVVTIFYHRGLTLVGQRKGSTGENTWAFVGGKVEKLVGTSDQYESPLQAAIREADEEVKLPITELRFITEATHRLQENGKPFRVFVFHAEFDGEPEIAEPHKMSDLKWVPLAEFLSGRFELFEAIDAYTHEIKKFYSRW